MSVGRIPLPIELPSAPQTTCENVARRYRCIVRALANEVVIGLMAVTLVR